MHVMFFVFSMPSTISVLVVTFFGATTARMALAVGGTTKYFGVARTALALAFSIANLIPLIAGVI